MYPKLRSNLFNECDHDSSWVTVYIGLGSNLEHPAEQIKSAHDAITQLSNVRKLAFSSLYHSPPMGPQNQPDYINAVMSIVTSLTALELLHSLQHLENKQGRIRNTERWGARTLDLDILVYDDQIINLPELVVPHRGLAERAFVLYPLHEIAPQLLIPGKGEIVSLLAECPMNGLKRLD